MHLAVWIAAIDDCWNRIGVRGDGSCPELKQYVHCRNCPVYSAGAADAARCRRAGQLPRRPDGAFRRAGAGRGARDAIGRHLPGRRRVARAADRGRRRSGQPAAHSFAAAPAQRRRARPGERARRAARLRVARPDRRRRTDRRRRSRERARHGLPAPARACAATPFASSVPVDEVHGIHRFHPARADRACRRRWRRPP